MSPRVRVSGKGGREHGASRWPAPIIRPRPPLTAGPGPGEETCALSRALCRQGRPGRPQPEGFGMEEVTSGFFKMCQATLSRLRGRTSHEAGTWGEDDTPQPRSPRRPHPGAQHPLTVTVGRREDFRQNEGRPLSSKQTKPPGRKRVGPGPHPEPPASVMAAPRVPRRRLSERGTITAVSLSGPLSPDGVSLGKRMLVRRVSCPRWL